ncbi:hypothetical protein [Thiothrix subterranea]|nr:hypothetical protein [Thiothrix subterranea]
MTTYAILDFETTGMSPTAVRAQPKSPSYWCVTGKSSTATKAS